MGWEVGDLALSLGSTKGEVGSLSTFDDGGIYRVLAVRGGRLDYDGMPSVGLYFGSEHCGTNGGKWLAAKNFRKIKPDTEPCEEEFTTLIKRGAKQDA